MSTSEDYEMLVPFSLGAITICLIGLTLIACKQIKIGSILFIIGCLPFIPIGIVGILGAKKVMNDKKEQQFLKEEYGSN